jgi:hypothetical protein
MAIGIMILFYILYHLYFDRFYLFPIFCRNISAEYVKTNLEDSSKRMFPFRYFQDENGETIPIVAVTGFFRENKAKELYYDYLKNGIPIIGITAYKTFPKKIMDQSEGEYETNDTFDYVGQIQNWMCCFRSPHKYGFTGWNNLADISESDFYDVDQEPEEPKKYDFIYVCNKDDDTCPINGWNAINRNFKLAKECFPIFINEYKLKGLIVGRVGCGLEQLYGDNVEITDFLDWHELQRKMRQSRFLFLPNVYDASPRVIAECITKGVPVLMNESILCGYKYISNETGEFFTDENNIRDSLNTILAKIGKISPKKWWSENYGVQRMGVKVRNFLYPFYPDLLENVEQMKFII